MKADVKESYRSSLFQVFNFQCREEPFSTSPSEYAESYDISFTRTGSYELYTGCNFESMNMHRVFLTNPGSEHRFRHGKSVTDTCMILRPSPVLIDEVRRSRCINGIGRIAKEQFFPRSFLPLTPSLDYLQTKFSDCIDSDGSLPAEVDEIGIRILDEVFCTIYQGHQNAFSNTSNPAGHMETVQRARKYILDHFDERLSLSTLARASFSSEYHLCRIFKSVTSYSPHQYLMEIRLRHASTLLCDTRKAVTDICYESGFSSLPHFLTSFRSRFRSTPREYRKRYRPAAVPEV